MNAVAAVLALALAGPPESTAFSVDPARSSVGFIIAHKLHEVRGTSRTVEGRALLGAGAAVKLMVRIPVESFDSGNANRDHNMREALDSRRYPHVTFKGTATLELPTAFPAKVPLRIAGLLDFHGRQRQEEIAVDVLFASPREARVVGAFPVSLGAYAVERPSLLLVKVEDACRIDLDLVLRLEGP